MACATQRDEAQSLPWQIATVWPRAGDLVSNSKKHDVIRLPHAADKGASSIAEESQRRQRAASILRALVERDIVPRLLAGASPSDTRPARPAPAESLIAPIAAPPPPDCLGREQVVGFATLLLAGATTETTGFVRRLRSDGIAADLLCLHLLTGAARHLGDLWAADLASFTDVTIATDHLQRLFRELEAEIPPPPRTEPPAAGRALLTTVPGEQHSFGVSMLSAFFRRAGWTVSTPNLRDVAALQRRVTANPTDLLGISLGAEMHMGQLTRCIERARRAARTELIVMVGGPIFVDRPELAHEVGADATAADAVGALAIAERLLRARQARVSGAEPPA